MSFSSLRELLQPERPRPLAQGEWLFTFDADARLGSTPVPLDEPAVTRILRDAYRLMEPYRYRWNRLLKVLPEGRLQAIAREVGTAGSDRHDTGTWFHWATLSDPEDCEPGEAWFPVLMLGRHYPDPEKDLPADKRRIGVRFKGSGLYHLKINASPVHLALVGTPDFPDLCTAVLAWKFDPQPRGRI